MENFICNPDSRFDGGNTNFVLENPQPDFRANVLAELQQQPGTVVGNKDTSDNPLTATDKQFGTQVPFENIWDTIVRDIREEPLQPANNRTSDSGMVLGIPAGDDLDFGGSIYDPKPLSEHPIVSALEQMGSNSISGASELMNLPSKPLDSNFGFETLPTTTRDD